MKEDEIVARIGAHVREERAGDAELEAQAAEAPLGDAFVARVTARVAPERPVVVAWPRRIAKVAAPLALAAAVVLFVATRGGGAGPELPGYGITASGEQAMRGSAEPSARLRVGHGAASRFEIVARPETAVGDANVVAWVFAIEGGEAQPVDARVDVSKEGAVRVSGDARVLGSANEVRIVVGTPESVATFDAALELAKAGRGDARARVLAVAVDR